MAKNTNKLTLYISLIAIAIVAVTLRIAWLHDNLFFGWEQGRDFLKLREIATGDPTLVGPKTDIDGVFHGALSYYIPFIPYLLFGGSPYWVLLSYIGVHILSMFFLYKSIDYLFSKDIALVSVFMYALSYSSIIYSQWLSNPNLVPALIIFYFYFLTRSEKNPMNLVLVAACWAIIFHLLVIVSISLIPVTVLYSYLRKIKLSFKVLSLSAIVIGLFLSPYILFELKNNFLMTTSFFSDHRSQGNFLVSGLGLLDQFLNEVIDGIIPIAPRFGFLIFIFVVFSAIKFSQKNNNISVILAFLFAMPLLFLFVSEAPLRHFHITVPVFLSVLIASVTVTYWNKGNKKISTFLFTVIVLGNIMSFSLRIPNNQANFIHHAQRTYLGDMKEIIDYTYKDANGKEFTYDYYSVPYWKEDAWIYLFQWYGKGKYGYAPEVDRTNVDRTENYYTIIEPNETVPVHLDNWYGEYKKDSELIEVFESGKLRVEKRKAKEL